MRRLIEDKDINAIVISTCNHWHALAAIWAMQAGKDVYCEKPVSNNLWEGRKIVEAARKSGVPELVIPAEIVAVPEVPVLGTGKTDYPSVQKLVTSRLGEAA